MKKIIYIALFSVAVLLSSCDDFLTENMKGDYNTESLFTSETGALRAINGTYNAISFNSSNNMIWVFGDVASDDAVKGGNPGDQADIRLIDEFNVNSDNGIIGTYWQFSYEAISRANNVIAYVPGISNMDADLKTRIVGEAKFIRAFSYFNLVNIWGKVPLKLYPQNTAANINVPLSSVADIYKQIEQDLNDAIAVLPKNYTTDADQGRVTQGAAYGLLAKAQLYQQKWSDCLQSINKLDALGLYSLTPVYEDLFKSGSEENPEAIFAIRHLSDQNPGLGNILNVWFAPSIESGYYFNAPTDSYIEAFNEKTVEGKDDPRLDASIGRDGKPWINGDTFSADWSPTGYLVKKHDQPLSEVSAGKKGDGNLPYIYLRYADILLMKAEAANESYNLPGATAAINQVRSRADLAPVIANSQGAMKDAIMLERRRELGFEFHRFFDLMRWGKTVATTALGSNFVWSEPRYYFPLPQAELDANQAL